MQVWYLLDSSLPAAVRKVFGYLRALPPAAAKLANNCLGERCWWRGDLNSCTKCFANEDVLIAL